MAKCGLVSYIGGRTLNAGVARRLREARMQNPPIILSKNRRSSREVNMKTHIVEIAMTARFL